MLPEEPIGPRAEGPATPAGCYRHPERETGVGCARCGRPICPECMVPASVGFQCPDCVRGAAAQTRRPTTRFGGGVSVRGADAPVTKVLIGLNLLVFVLTEYVDRSLQQRLGMYSWVPVPGVRIGVAAGPEEWYRLVTAAFVHAGPTHIVMNMVSLWVLGPQLERVLGRLRFLALYLVSGVAGNAFAYLVSGSALYSVGASGAIFGLLGATVVLYRAAKAPLTPVLVLLAVNLVITFSLSNLIDWRAHLGGLVAGGVTAVGMMYAPRAHRDAVQGLTVAAVLGVALLLMLAGTARLTG